MKKLIFTFLFLFSFIRSQTICPVVIAYDNMEIYTWLGDWWIPGGTSGFYTNAFVSSNVSAAIYGSGSGTSAYESNWYSMPDLVVNPANAHIFQFRLASYRFSNSTATTAGTDVADYITVQLSTDGGITYVNELRVTGNNNAYWDYNTNATAAKTANGVLTTVGPAAGGNRTTTGDGYSIVRLTIPAGFTNIAIDIFCRANAAGEEWWIDNVELIEQAPCTPLPIELILFKLTVVDNDVNLNWTTASEFNNNYFKIERSLNAINWEPIGMVPGVGNSTTEKYYSFIDHNLSPNLYYYRLRQVDINGDIHYSSIIEANLIKKEECDNYEYFNLNGVKIDIDKVPSGIYIGRCGDKIIKVFKN
jgi:hypothetical protein